MCKHTKIVCPRHGGGFDCTPFCNLCEANQEFCPTCESVNITNDDWETIYLPMVNHLDSTGERLAYETYGDELEYVLLQDDHHVWTEVDGDNGVYIVNGYHIVNRIQYYITNKPWNDGDNICITVSEDVTCSCYNEDSEEANPDCNECGGEGFYTKWNW